MFVWAASSVVILLAVLANGEDPMQVCWRNAYGRGFGSLPNRCADGHELDAGLCYPNCTTGYGGVGPVCWEYCGQEYTDIGALCVKDPHVRWPCPWYDICGLTFAKECHGKCNTDEVWSACMCKRPKSTIIKSTYGRGFGKLPSCGDDQDHELLCYKQCSDGFKGIGPVCWEDHITGTGDFPTFCNPFINGKTGADCDKFLVFLKSIGIDTAKCLQSLATSVGLGTIMAIKECISEIRAVINTVKGIPVCPPTNTTIDYFLTH